MLRRGLNERGAIFTRVLDDGRVLDVMPQFYNVMLGVSESVKADTYIAEY